MTNRRFKRTVLFCKFIFLIYLGARAGYLLKTNLDLIGGQYCIFGILPSEFNLLDFFLNQPHQEQEWVQLVRRRIQNPISSLEYELFVRDVLNIEMCYSTQEKKISMYKVLFYNREDPRFFILPSDLSLILHVHLEDIFFNHSALSEVLGSLCAQGHESFFYEEVKSHRARDFEGFLAQKHQKKLEIKRSADLIDTLKKLEERHSFFVERNTFLQDKLKLLDREG